MSEELEFSVRQPKEQQKGITTEDEEIQDEDNIRDNDDEGPAHVDHPTASPRRDGTDKLLLVVLLIPSFVQKVAERMMIPVLPVFAKKELGASSSMIGTLGAAMALGKLMCNIPSGWIVSLFYDNDKQGQSEYAKNLVPVVIAALVMASAFVVAGISTSVIGLMSARLLEGAGLSLWVLARQSLFNELTTKENRGRFMSTLGGVARIAAIFGPYFGGLLATSNPRWSFWCQAAINVGNALLVVGIMVWIKQHQNPRNEYMATAITELEAEGADCSTRDQDPDDGPSDTEKLSGDTPAMSWGDLILHHGWTLFSLAIFAFCMAVVRASRHLLFPLKAIEIGYDAHAIGVMTSITFIVESTVFPAAGYLMDHYGRKYSGILSLSVMGSASASVPVLAKMYPTSIAALTVASAGFGLGNGLSSGLLMSMAGDASPSEGQDRAKFLALFRTFTDSGLLLGPWICGLLADHFSVSAGFQVLAGVAAAGTLWMVFVIPETNPAASHHRHGG